MLFERVYDIIKKVFILNINTMRHSTEYDAFKTEYDALKEDVKKFAKAARGITKSGSKL